MSSKNIILIIGLIVLLIAYLKYNQSKYFNDNTNLNEINIKPKNFNYITTPTPIEHFVKINDNYLLGTGLQYPEIFITKEYLTYPIKNDSLFLYNIKHDQLTELKINNFPKEVGFHPQALSLLKISEGKYYIYVVNHAILYHEEKCEDRIEKILLETDNNDDKKFILSFEDSSNFPENYFGLYISQQILIFLFKH